VVAARGVLLALRDALGAAGPTPYVDLVLAATVTGITVPTPDARVAARSKAVSVNARTPFS
jgi:predicted naringenin-chalcone synthase